MHTFSKTKHRQMSQLLDSIDNEELKELFKTEIKSKNGKARINIIFRQTTDKERQNKKPKINS